MDAVAEYAGAIVKTGSSRAALGRAGEALEGIARVEEEAFGLLSAIE
jgi:hypothetical protein